MACKATFWVEGAMQNGSNPAVFDVLLRVLPHDTDYTGAGTCSIEEVSASVTLLGITDACKDAVKDHLTNNGVTFNPILDSVRALHPFNLA